MSIIPKANIKPRIEICFILFRHFLFLLLLKGIWCLLPAYVVEPQFEISFEKKTKPVLTGFRITVKECQLMVRCNKTFAWSDPIENTAK